MGLLDDAEALHQKHSGESAERSARMEARQHAVHAAVAAYAPEFVEAMKTVGGWPKRSFGRLAKSMSLSLELDLATNEYSSMSISTTFFADGTATVEDRAGDYVSERLTPAFFDGAVRSALTRLIPPKQ